MMMVFSAYRAFAARTHAWLCVHESVCAATMPHLHCGLIFFFCTRASCRISRRRDVIVDRRQSSSSILADQHERLRRWAGRHGGGNNEQQTISMAATSSMAWQRTGSGGLRAVLTPTATTTYLLLVGAWACPGLLPATAHTS